MTVNKETPYSSATITEGVSDYNFDFTIQNEDELDVYVTETGSSPVLLGLNEDYSVTLNGTGPNPGWGYITLLTAQPVGALLEMGRDMTLDQTIPWSNYGDLPMDLIEDSFDKTALIDQQLQEGLDRALKAAPGTSGNYTLPPAEPNRVIGVWDENAEYIVIGPTANEISSAQGYATQASNSAVLAQQWAENPEDVPVVPDEFSAFHWSKKAEESAADLPSASQPWTWAAIQNYGAVELPINAGVVDWFLNSAPSAFINLTESIVMNAPTYTLTTEFTTANNIFVPLVIDDVGGNAITWDEAYEFGAAGNVQPTANGKTVYVFYSDGTKYYFMSSNITTAP